MPWYYYIIKATLRILLLLFTRCQIIGKENIPKQGRLLVVANHLSLVDPPLLSFVVNRKMAFMAKKELFHYSIFLKYLIRSFGAFPVSRGQLNRKALHQAENVLTNGLPLIIFPEGMRSRSGKLQSAYPGVAFIAFHSSAPILPIGISGTEKITGITWLLRRPHIKINIGQSFYLPQVNSKLTKANLANLTNYVMGQIAELLPPEYRGEYIAEN
ncbi:lysophospholipid acyltransferase family protein [Chloroflexota bacterium]